MTWRLPLGRLRLPFIDEAGLAVELFTIHCTTCRTRLKVNDESVIGDILSCPKCGSMVQVVPPVGWSRSPTAEPPAQQLALPPKGSVPAAPSTSPSVVRKTAVPPPSLPGRSPSPPPAFTTTARPPASNPAATKAAVPAPPPIALLSVTSTGQWERPTLAAQPSLASPASQSTPRRSLAAACSAIAAHARQEWKLLAGALGSGIALGGAIWLVLAIQAPTVEPAADANRVSSTLSGAREASPNADTPTAPAASAPEQPRPEAPTVAVGDRKSESKKPSTVVAKPEELAVEQPPPAIAQEAAQVGLPVPPSEPASSASPVQPRATIKLEPAPAAEAAAAGAVNPEAGATTANTLSTAVPAQSPSDPDAAAEAVAADSGDSQGSPVTLLTADQIEGRLAQPLAKIEFSKTPLPKFLDFIGDLAGVRVRMDEGALAHVKSGGAKAVSIQMSDTTAGDALQAAAARLGLAYVIRDGQIVMTLASERDK